MKWRTPSVGSRFDQPFVPLVSADLDGDGSHEIAAAERDFWTGGRLAVFEASTGALEAGPFSTIGFEGFVAFDLDGERGKELLATDAFGAVVEVDTESGNVSPPLLTLGAGRSAMRAADVTRDGIEDLLVVAAGRFHIFDGTDLSPVWASDFLSRTAGWHDTLYIGDFLGDSLPEVVVGTGHGFALFSVQPVPVFSDSFESGDLSDWSHSTP